MTLREIVQKIAALAEDPQYKVIKKDWILHYLSLGQIDIATRTKVLVAEDTSNTSVASQGNYSLPTRCIEVRQVYYDGVPLTPIQRWGLDEMERGNYASTLHWLTETGTVERYMIDWDENDLRLWKVPAVGGKTIKMRYAYVPTDFTKIGNTISLPYYCENALMLFGLHKAHKKLQTQYKDQHSLAQAQIWAGYSRDSKNDYEMEIIKIENIRTEFLKRRQPKKSSESGLIFEEDEYGGT